MYDAAEVKQHIAKSELKKLQEFDQVRVCHRAQCFISTYRHQQLEQHFSVFVFLSFTLKIETTLRFASVP